jgi:hypothetical protein
MRQPIACSYVSIRWIMVQLSLEIWENYCPTKRIESLVRNGVVSVEYFEPMNANGPVVWEVAVCVVAGEVFAKSR